MKKKRIGYQDGKFTDEFSEMKNTPKKPDWWPKNPYPESVFPTTIDEYIELIPDPHNRSAISGCLGRHFWDLCQDEIWKRFCEYLEEEEVE